MASAALMSSGPVQSLCRSCSSAKIWQPKRLFSSGSILTRASPHGHPDRASILSLISFRPLDSVFGRLRRSSGLGHETRNCSSRYMFNEAGEKSVSEDGTQSSAPGTANEIAEENVESVPAAGPPPPAKLERFMPRIPGQRFVREDPTVPAEALVEGAVFTGRVTSIQPFGAFVNFGASRDGLVHISKLSTSFVRNVSDMVNLGQEVKVTILSVDQTSGRIALSMVGRAEREAAATTGDARGGDGFRFQQGLEGRAGNRGRIAGGGWQNRQDEFQRPPTTLSKGQEVEGTVKNKIRSGVFVQLPDFDEGFLRYSDVPGGENMSPESFLHTGKKIKATVLMVDRGRISLTMKPTADTSSVNREIDTGNDVGATNPFQTSFRALNMIPAEPRSPVLEAPRAEEKVSARPPGYWKNFGSEGSVTSIEDIFATDEQLAPAEASIVEGKSSDPEIAAPVVQPIDEEEVSLDSIKQIAAWVRNPPPQ